MSITHEQQMELDRFPEPLSRLIIAELAAGNSIVEVGHSFPAPPVGAYVKLAKHVTTRPRATCSELDFTERNHSLYSGVFTDQKGFFFVLEPPGIVTEPVTRALDTASTHRNQSTDESTNQVAERLSTASLPKPPLQVSEVVAPQQPASPNVQLVYELRFSDRRSPHEVRVILERRVMTLFRLAWNDGKLCMHARALVVGAEYRFELHLVAARESRNEYWLRVNVSWPRRDGTHDDYYRQSSRGWIDFWTRDFSVESITQGGGALVDTPSTGVEAVRYAELCEAAMTAEQHLDSVASLQQEIVALMKKGAYFASSHKEGGTRIVWYYDRFLRSDFGDSKSSEAFTDESKFLQMLAQFCQFEISRSSAGETLSEIDRWRLILRMLNA